MGNQALGGYIRVDSPLVPFKASAEAALCSGLGAGTGTGLCCAGKVGERAAVHQVELRIENSTWTWYFVHGLGITALSSQAFSSRVLHNKINVFCTFSV